MWYKVLEVPSKEVVQEMRHTIIAERLRNGKTLNPKRSHLNRHHFCAQHKDEATADDERAKDALARSELFFLQSNRPQALI